MTNITPSTQSTPYTWYVIALMFGVNMLNYIDRMVLAVLVESIREEIPMTDTQIGILTGLAFAVFYAFAGIIIGRLADSMSRKKIMLAAISVWSLATAACGLAGSFLHLLLARFTVGAGEAGSTPCAQSMLADYCNYRIRPAAYAVFSAGGTLGLTVGLAGGGYIADLYGWRTAFFVAGALGIPVILILGATLQEPTRGAQDGGASTMTGTSFFETLSFLLSRKSYPFIVLSSTATAFLLFGVAQWIPAYLIRAFELTQSEVGAFFGLAMGAGSAIGAVIGGVLCSRLVERDISWLLLIPIIAGSTFVPLYLVALHTDTLGMALSAVFVVNLVGALGFGPTVAAMHSVVPAGMRGTGTAFYGLTTSLLGVGLAPFLIGLLSDTLGGGTQDANSLRLALSAAIFISLANPLMLLFARKTFREDQVVQVG